MSSGKKLATNDRKWATPGRRNKMTSKLWEKIMEDLEATGNLEASAAKNGISVSTIYKYMKRHGLEEDYEIARHRACLRLEAEAWRRAVEGTEKGVYFNGQLINYEREYSDRLLELLLKSQRPDKYSNKAQIDVNHNHSVSGDAKDKLGQLLGISDQSNDGEIIDAEYTDADDED